jgi:muramidase (phage lysozyme)
VISALPEGDLKNSLREKYGSHDLADTEMDATQQAFLQTIGEPESGNKYNILEGSGHETFSNFADHPRRIGAGGSGTAAGRYQINEGTWDWIQKYLHLPDFSPKSQDKAAWFLADWEYRRQTGRDLKTDYKSGMYHEIADAIKGRWPTVAGAINEHRFETLSNENLGRTPPPAPIAPEWSETPLQAARRLMGGPDTRPKPAPLPKPPLPPLYAGMTIPPGSLPNVSATSGLGPRATGVGGAPTTHNNDNSSRSEVSINQVNVHTQAKDSASIAESIQKELNARLVIGANRGMQ